MEWLNKIINLIKTIPSRISEPSTWAGVGVGLTGLVLVASGQILLGLIVAVAGVVAIVMNETKSEENTKKSKK
jgi:hypothetical protein|tara:strand:+ start:1359 stop:1577 length:219 start_codon:yes stop_codon:yes gene_type:complete